jgi:hypothetical protein
VTAAKPPNEPQFRQSPKLSDPLAFPTARRKPPDDLRDRTRKRRTTTAIMRLTTDVINNSLSFINPVQERELDLRGALKRADTTLA